MRVSITEAIAKGWITRDEARRMMRESLAVAARRSRHIPGLDGGGLFCPIEGRTPQERLWRAICVRWPRRALWEHRNAVPGRRFRVDIAFPRERLAVEVDGWACHGRHLSGFRRDREKDRLLVLHGWRVFRVAAGEVHRDLEGVLAWIERLLSPETGGSTRGRK